MNWRQVSFFSQRLLKNILCDEQINHYLTANSTKIDAVYSIVIS